MRLIDANELKRWLESIAKMSARSENEEGFRDGVKFAIKAIDETHTVEKRQHGHWIKNVVGIPKCSCCGCIAPCEGDSYTVTYCCPHCGAKMDEVTDDGQ